MVNNEDFTNNDMEDEEVEETLDMDHTKLNGLVIGRMLVVVVMLELKRRGLLRLQGCR